MDHENLIRKLQADLDERERRHQRVIRELLIATGNEKVAELSDTDLSGGAEINAAIREKAARPGARPADPDAEPPKDMNEALRCAAGRSSTDEDENL